MKMRRASDRVLLYTQRGIGGPGQGHRVVTSAHLAAPRGKPPKEGWPIITWGHGTSGIADPCAFTRDSNLEDVAKHGPLLQG